MADIPSPETHEPVGQDSTQPVHATQQSSPLAAVPDDTTAFDSPETGAAIDEIAAQDGDELLEVEDQTTVLTNVRTARWWQHAWLHWLFTLMLFSGFGALAGLPATRYWILNHATVRSSANVTVVDEITHQPLQRVHISLAGMHTQTDNDGKAVLHGVRLGPTILDISQPGFSAVHRNVVIGWGSNPFDIVELKAVGVPYHVVITDWLSGKPITGARIENDTAAAQSDTNGNAMLILPNEAATDVVAVTITADGYRTEKATLRAATSTPTALVTSRKAVYVSKQSGVYDLYASDADGQNKQVLLPGTGNEGVNISLVVSPDGMQAALVSTRDKQFDADGYPLSTLTLVDISTGNSTVLTHADQIQLVDWIGTRLVFEQALASGTDRYSIISYDYASNSRYQLATAARFNGVLSAQGMVYYAVAPNADNPAVQPYLYRVGPNGSNKQTLLEKEVWSMYRTGYDSLSLQTSDNWYTHTVSTKNNIITSAPGTLASKVFIDQSGQSNRSLWVDMRSGQGTLLLHDSQTNADTILHSKSGLAYPVRWLTGDSAIFRVVTSGETADYAVGTTAGRPAYKIANVTNTYGFSVGQ